MFARIAFPIPIDRGFSYAVPDRLAEGLALGMRVTCPFGRGNRTRTGYVVELTDTCDYDKVKSVIEVLDDHPLLDDHMMDLCRWLASYYVSSLGEALEAALPSGVRQDAQGRTRTLVQMNPAIQAELFAQEHYGRARKRKQVLEAAADLDGPMLLDDLALLAGTTVDTVRKMVDDGALVAEQESVLVDDLFGARRPRFTEGPHLTEEQAESLKLIIDALTENTFAPFLLYGVTGSGKTEVYLKAIERVVADGGQAIVLVPEISLTPQTVDRFRDRFPQVAVLHSHLTPAERNLHWRALESGQANIVVGARSAVFAPLRKLRLIVIDEEHETSFKQEITPRYNARDVAVMRAKMLNIPVVLGSATPSLESWHNAQTGRYTRLELPRRVADRQMPPVEIVDMAQAISEGLGYRLLSRPLENRLKRCLEAGHQAILFQNRRGYSTYIMCQSCGHVQQCPECDVSMTYHQKGNVLKCHYCGRMSRRVEQCPECGKPLQYKGVGTERLEEVLTKLFPNHAVRRMDSDTTRKRNAHEQILGAFRRGEFSILVGTQMVTKGLDFPNVTVVGVVNADHALNMPDFRATERTFQLLAQVSGRAGRSSKGGRVVVQTFNPQNAAVVHAAKHDYRTFAEEEMRHRQPLGYPPFGRLVRLLAQGADEGEARQIVEQIAKIVRQCAGEKPITLLGPAPAPITQIGGQHRWHLLMKGASPADLHEMLWRVKPMLEKKGRAQVTVDVDPMSMM